MRKCFPGQRIKFISGADAAPAGSTLVVWGAHPVDEAESRGLSVVRVEDGFLRSVGLGADLIQPLSWVVDRRGIYFDATRPSDLEILLEEGSFPEALQARAAELRKRIVQSGLTKYNVGADKWRRPERDITVILVPGQVESDASIAFGAPTIRTNIGLLQAVRTANSSAYIVYKPHPDVVAGLRSQGKGENDVSRWCDEVVVDAGMGDLLLQVDEIHCLTSLAGFEGLLRNKRVVCYGQPFYAGWGLTSDISPIARRTKRRTIDELVAGALIQYPCYMSRKGPLLVSPEQALDELTEWRSRDKYQVSIWRKLHRSILRRIVGVR